MKKIPLILITALLAASTATHAQMTQEARDAMTPADVLDKLMAGNASFAADDVSDPKIPTRIRATATGQFPMAYILSCVDSRVPAELVFDQGIGDLFVGRVAGNSENQDQLGSMEFATAVTGAKLIFVLGHSACGAIAGACDGVELGNLTPLLESIQPAVRSVQNVPEDQRNSSNSQFVNDVAQANVRITMGQITTRSPILKELVENGELKIAGGFYDLETGKVSLID